MEAACLLLCAMLVFWVGGLKAADKSGMRPNVLSMPAGPGSIEGLGATFEPQLNTGTASYRVPLKCPPGRNGFSPALELVYDGGFGNGILGVGWRLDLPFVGRQTSGRQPYYTDYPVTDGSDNDHDGEVDEFDEFDTFFYDGKEELVPTADGYWRFSTESTFLRLKRDNAGWSGQRKDGVTLKFGTTAASRVQDGLGRAYVYCLDEMADVHGNRITFEWSRLDDTYQIYCTAIRYNEGQQVAVNFSYERRPDVLTSYRARFELKTAYRCRQIHITERRNTVRAYRLDYAPESEFQPLSLLASVTEVGTDLVTQLPPATFQYVPFAGATAQTVLLPTAPAVDLNDGNLQFIDLNSDALPDILDSSQNPHRYFMNLGPLPDGTVEWSSQRSMTNAINVHLAAGTTEVADLDGNFRADLLNLIGPRGELFVIDQNLEWSRRPNITGANFSLLDPNVRLLDANGDRFIDVMRTDGSVTHVWTCLNAEKWSAPFTVASPNSSLQFGRSTTRLADMNGDRIMDLVYLANEACYYHPGIAHGEFGGRVDFDNPPTRVIDPARLLLLDVNGDGMSDVLHVGDSIRVWVNRGVDPDRHRNARFASLFTIATPYVNATTVFRTGDLNGNGSVDLIVNSVVSGQRRLAHLDLAAGEQPGQLKRARNGTGRTITVGYLSSVANMVRDRRDGRPWPDAVPIPVPVVDRVEVDAGAPAQVQEFRYHDGYYDIRQEQFRGFGRAEQRDIGDAGAPDLVTSIQYDTGRTVEALKGSILVTETGVGPYSATWPHLDGRDNDGDGTADEADEFDPAFLSSREENRWQTLVVAPPVAGDMRRVTFPYIAKTIRDVFEKGQGGAVRLRWDYVYDSYGNLIETREYGHDDPELNDERVTKTTFTAAYPSGRASWLLDKEVEQSVEDKQGLLVSRSRHYYDGFKTLGEITKGDLTRVEDWVEGERYVTSVESEYDVHGNVRTIRDPLFGQASGHYREIVYDEFYQTFPVREIIHTGNGNASPLTISAEYDFRFGVVTRWTEPDGHATRFFHDEFGRITAIVRPGDAEAYPSVEYAYVLGVPVGTNRIVNFIETRLLDQTPGAVATKRDHYFISRQFVDGLGLTRMTKTEAEPALGSEAPRVVVSGVAQFNARRQPARALNPFFSLQGGTLEELLGFEDIEAPGWQGQFQGEGDLVSLDLSAAHATYTAYDATLRSTEVTNPDGTRSRTVYEPRRTLSYDENDNDPASPFFDTPMVQHHDGLGRLIRVDEVTRLNDDGTTNSALRTWTTRYAYDLNDQLTQITDSQNNVKVFAYDGLKRKVFMGDPDRGVMHFVFDDASNLIETTDAKGQRITYTFDGANRILTEDYHDEGLPFSRNFVFNPALPVSPTNRPDVAYFYDEPLANLDIGDGSFATAANTKGRLAYVWDLSGEEHTGYDARGRVDFLVKRVRDPLHGQLVSYRTGFAFDTLDRVTTLTYPDNDAVGFRYNQRSLLTRIVGGPTGSIISNVLYSPSGQQERLLYGNGVATSQTYDPRLRLKTLVTARQADPASPLISFGYDFDAVSNIRSIADNRPGSVVSAGDKRRNTQLFRYDDLYRLTHAQYSFELPGQPKRSDGEINYRYDRIGNMLAQTSSLTNHVERGLPVADMGEMSSGGSAGRFNRQSWVASDPPGPHALTSITNPKAHITEREFPYDPNGNMTNLDGMVATWDFKDRLVALEDSTLRAEYAYDFSDRRITKRVSPKTPDARLRTPTTVTYVGKHFEVREHEAPTKFVWNSDTRVARVTGTLSPNERVQRLRVNQGWNLVSVAVTAANGGSQLAASGQTDGLYRWNPATRDFEVLATTDTLSAGSVLWIRALADTTLRVTGMYPGPKPNLRGPPEGAFLPGYGLEPLPLTNQPSSLTAWHFAPDLQAWQTKVGRTEFQFSDLPPVLAVGGAIYALPDQAVDLVVPDPALSLRFYHQDHLGSSSVLTDAGGALVEESANYPFGSPRVEFRPGGTRNDYQFTQKEQDAESGMHYFEARFLASSYGRFTRVDAMAIHLDLAILNVPQGLNPYAYSLNNPLKFHDPSGDVWGLVVKAAKIVIKGGDMASTVASVLADVGTLRDPNASGWAKAGAMLSIASEIASPVSFKESKAGVKAAEALLDGRKVVDNLNGVAVGLTKGGLGNVGKASSKRATHGNILDDRPATLYEKYDKDGNFLKHGITKHEDPSKRYTKKQIAGGEVRPIERGPRSEMAKKERDRVEKNPGSDNREPWAGKRKTSK